MPDAFDVKAARKAANIAHPVHCRTWLREACDQIEDLEERLNSLSISWANLERAEKAEAAAAKAAEYCDAIFDTGREKGLGFCIQVAGLARGVLRGR